MPFMSFIAGILGYILATKFDNNYFVTGIVIATIIPISVSWMLNQVLSIPLLATLPYLFISEQIVCFLGSIIFKAIEKRYTW
jgi:uncharacterized membrane protein